MNLSPFGSETPGQRVARWGGGVGVLFGIMAVLTVAFSQPLVRERAEQWVEVVVQKKAPPAPTPPPPPPEEKKPDPPKPKPKEVKFEELQVKPPDNQPPPPVDPPPRQVRRVQGLSSSSFSATGNTGLSVNAGNSLQVAASSEKMTLEEANGPLIPRAYTAVSKLPVLISPPPMEVPKEAREAGLAGEIKVTLDLDPNGKVTAVRIVRGLGMGTDEACQAAWRASRWKPAEQDGTAVAVKGVPQNCLVVQTN